jgi:hypothetical protein
MEPIIKDLGKLKSKTRLALKEAINITAKYTAGEMPDAARREYFAKKGRLKKTMSIEKAKAGKLEAYIKSTSRPSSLYDFKVSPKKYIPGGGNVKRGYLANAKKDMEALRLVLRPDSKGDKYKAFIIKFKSGHIALAQRVPGEKMKGNSKKEAVKTIYSLSYSKVLEVGFFETVEPVVYDRLQIAIDQQIAKHVGGFK